MRSIPFPAVNCFHRLPEPGRKNSAAILP